MAQANTNAYTQLRNGNRKQFEKPAWKFEHSSNRLHGKIESVQLIPTGIQNIKLLKDKFNKISLLEMRLGSTKA